MRKLTAVLLMGLYILSSMPAVVFSAENTGVIVSDGAKMEQMLQIVRSKFDIPDTYQEFHYSKDTYGEETVYRFNWSSPYYVTKEGGNLEVTVDLMGNIKSYYHYKQTGEYEYRRKLPSLSKDQAILQAKKFISLVSPELLDQLLFEDDYMMKHIEFDGNYRFVFFRTYKNIPFYDNFITITLNGRTGDVINYARDWTDGITFPEPQGIIKREAAEKAYKEQIGLQLGYRRTYGEDQVRSFLVYAPDGNTTRAAIQAFSGVKIIEGEGNLFLFDEDYKEEAYRRTAQERNLEIGVSQQDIDELMRAGKIITLETAVKLLQNTKELELNDKYVLKRSSYTRNTETGLYTLRLEFAMMPGEEIGKSMLLDSQSGELLQYEVYYYGEKTEGVKPAQERSVLQKQAEAFLKNIKPDKFAETKLVDGNAYNNLYDIKYGLDFGDSPGNFIFVRTVAGVPFQDNRLELNIDPGTGQIIYYSEQWDAMGFTSPVEAITLDQAYQVLFKNNPLKLKYISTTEIMDQKTEAPGGKPGQIQLVYAPDFRISSRVDALKGILINTYNDQPFAAKGSVLFQDIKGSKIENQMKILAETGIIPAAADFRPRDKMSQKEFLNMIARIKYDTYYLNSGTGQLSQKEIDSMYRILMNDNILEASDKNPDKLVTREEGLTYLLRALGYKKFAEIEGIFQLDFIDKKDINPELTGYVAIAKGLHLIDHISGAFLPKAALTREEAATLIYNGLVQ